MSGQAIYQAQPSKALAAIKAKAKTNQWTQQEIDRFKRLVQTYGLKATNKAPSPPTTEIITLRTIDALRVKQKDQGMETVTAIMNTCRANGKMPPEWKQSSTILIHKGDDPLALDNWWPIALQNTLYIVYAAVIARRVTSWAVDTGVMSQAQKEGCLEHNHLITSVLQDSRKRPAFLTWLDLKDAYGSVPHEILLKAMELAGLEDTTLRIVEDFYHQTAITMQGRPKDKNAHLKQLLGKYGLHEGGSGWLCRGNTGELGSRERQKLGIGYKMKRSQDEDQGECPGGDDESHMALAASGDLEEHEEAEENEDPEEIGQRSATIGTPTATRSRHSEAGK
eukprot:Em0007g1214a